MSSYFQYLFASRIDLRLENQNPKIAKKNRKTKKTNKKNTKFNSKVLDGVKKEIQTENPKKK